MAYKCEVWRVYPATAYERTAATMDFILVDCILPTSVNAGEPFDIQVKYKLHTIETRNPDGILSHFPDIYHGAYYRYLDLLHTRIEYWYWRLIEMGLTLVENPPGTMPIADMAPGEIKIDTHAQLVSGDIFTYTFHGTIEQLLGRQFTEPTTVELAWSIFGSIYGWYEPDDWWPWQWVGVENYYDFSRVCWINHSIQVNIPPPEPYPIFNVDLCSVSKATVAPSEQFTIGVAIENQNETSGRYSIGCYCEGNYTELGSGTIAGNGTKSHTFSVTANQLAQRSITSSQYLAFTIAVSNDEGETDRWTPAAIAVIVDEPPEASLSGRVTDKQTGYGLVGVSIATSDYSTSTSAGGYYQLEGLEPGKYEIEFVKDGYWDSVQTKTVYAGENTLDVILTPETEPKPGEIPWKLIAAGVGVTGIIILAKSKRGSK